LVGFVFGDVRDQLWQELDEMLRRGRERERRRILSGRVECQRNL